MEELPYEILEIICGYLDYTDIIAFNHVYRKDIMLDKVYEDVISASNKHINEIAYYRGYVGGLGEQKQDLERANHFLQNQIDSLKYKNTRLFTKLNQISYENSESFKKTETQFYKKFSPFCMN